MIVMIIKERIVGQNLHSNDDHYHELVAKETTPKKRSFVGQMAVLAQGADEDLCQMEDNREVDYDHPIIPSIPIINHFDEFDLMNGKQSCKMSNGDKILKPTWSFCC